MNPGDYFQYWWRKTLYKPYFSLLYAFFLQQTSPWRKKLRVFQKSNIKTPSNQQNPTHSKTLWRRPTLTNSQQNTTIARPELMNILHQYGTNPIRTTTYHPHIDRDRSSIKHADRVPAFHDQNLRSVLQDLLYGECRALSCTGKLEQLTDFQLGARSGRCNSVNGRCYSWSPGF